MKQPTKEGAADLPPVTEEPKDLWREVFNDMCKWKNEWSTYARGGAKTKDRPTTNLDKLNYFREHFEIKRKGK